MKKKPKSWPNKRLTTLVAELLKQMLKPNAKLKQKLTLFLKESSKLKLLLLRNKQRRKLQPKSSSRLRSPRLSEKPRRKRPKPRKKLN